MAIESAIFSGAIALVFSGIGWAIKRSIVGEIEIIGIKVGAISDKIDSSREMMIRDYATKADLSANGLDNKASHAQFWSEINIVKERMVKVETTQGNCKECNGRG
jgi:hypothetical protein